MSNRSIPKPEPSPLSLGDTPETDLTELAALFAARSGQGVSAKLSTDLALEIVLNEIVEQACLATGATGAAVILEREREMVCRATSGSTAPELGSHPDAESGLTAECLRTGEIQLCDDASNDSRADPEASRNLGVCSIIALPLIQDGAVIGVLEAFSSRPAAFRERDRHTLEALAERILKNLKRASQPVAVPAAAHDTSLADKSSPHLVEGTANHRVDPGASASMPESGRPETLRPVNRVDILTVVLASACVVCLVLIITLLAVRASSRNAAARQNVAPELAQSDGTTPALAQQSPTESPPTVPAAASEPSSTSAKPVPSGGLAVFEGEKEVFRLPPSPVAGAKTLPNSTAVEPSQVMTMSAAAAQSSLIYRVEPDYPEEARRRGIQGAVMLDVRIARDGAVQNATVVSGNDILGKAAAAAVKQWRFRPYVAQGRPAEMQTRVTLNFWLPQ